MSEKQILTKSAGRWLLIHLFISGMSTIAVEVAAFRLLAPSFGSTQFITTNVLGVVLASLAAGYWAGGRIADRAPRAAVLYYLSIAGALALVALPFAADPVLRAARPAITNQDASLFAGTLATMAALFAVPMFLLGTVSPFAIRILSSGDERAGSRSGLVFAVSTVGSIAGAYLPSLVTIAWIGTRASIQLFGGVVLISAAAGLLIERRALAGALALAIVTFPAVAISHPMRPARAANILDERETDYHVVRVVRDDRQKRNLLEINEGLSFHSMAFDDGRLSENVWGFFQLFPLMAEAPPGGKKPRLDICIVGLAAGTIASQIEKAFGGEFTLKIDGVEIDPVIVELGRKYFGLDERFLKVWIEDGRTFLARTSEKYDFIIGDAYRQPYVPAHLVTREYFEIVKQHLKPGGICAVNVGALDNDSVVLRGIQNAMIEVFGPGSGAAAGSVERFVVLNSDVPFSNYVCMASDRPIRARWGSIERTELLAHRDAALKTWGILEKDAGAPVFTDDRAPVEWYTDLSLLKYASK